MPPRSRSCARWWPTATALRPPCWKCSRACCGRHRRRPGNPPLHLPFDHQLLDLGDRLCRIEALGAGLGAVEDGVAAIEAERILEIVEPLASRRVAAVDDPAIGLQQHRPPEI